MKQDKPAILGGRPVRTEPFPAYNPIGEEEKLAVAEVIDSGSLSRFLGENHPNFYGGSQVRAFEEEWCAALGSRYAISVNSCTSGLYAAMGAIGVGPGDEVIVSPYTMSASAIAPVVFNAVPVFADIDPRTYCLDPDSVRSKVTERTRAIIVVHLFGQPADMDGINAIAREYNLKVIEDCAQAPFATYKGKPVGTLGDIGVFSFNYHKHIHTGEGGIVTTDDEHLARRLQLIRNHGEAVVSSMPESGFDDIVGFNFRMGEIEAAIGRCQLQKAPSLIERRVANVKTLEAQLKDLPGLTMPWVDEGNFHVYYVHVMRFDSVAWGISLADLVRALSAELPVTKLREDEGPLVSGGYVKPLYHQPIYQRRSAYGKVPCPFDCPHYHGKVSYAGEICPQAEAAHTSVLVHEWIRPGMTESDLEAVSQALHKLWQYRGVLAGVANTVTSQPSGRTWGAADQ